MSFFEMLKRKLFLMKVSPNLRPAVKHAWNGGSMQDFVGDDMQKELEAMDATKFRRKFNRMVPRNLRLRLK